ncbi:MAG: helix-turn-helix domain-containing protein [Pyrinomonadaceae bacterium]
MDDLLTEKLLGKLKDYEDGFTERKLEGVSSEDVCKTLVAFANSLRDNEEAYLFIGIADNGEIKGVSKPTEIQKWIKKLAERTCYPAIHYINKVVAVDGKPVIAVIVRASTNKPHFARPAYIRKGSESVEASPELYEELIASRNDKARRILREKGEVISVWRNFIFKSNYVPGSKHTCKIVDCDAFFVSLYDMDKQEDLYIPLEHIYISRDGENQRMLLHVRAT